ncbi:uncharacterized protein LOC118647113 [Monomorium pharaonis]|uniref:uncharacterized protein LOC118647113 n=1 Tax=Monomorium pharaonis TaxID=307658 RepID=UPI001745E1C0|nr:uncharacterized protein LOC118647113 [Monomorium pharaonis]
MGIQGLRCLVYLDDIVIYGSSLNDHNKRLTEVLQRLREANLKLQPDKYEFLRKEVNYLGHVISEDGISKVVIKIDVTSLSKRLTQVEKYVRKTDNLGKMIAVIGKETCENLHSVIEKGELHPTTSVSYGIIKTDDPIEPQRLDTVVTINKVQAQEQEQQQPGGTSPANYPGDIKFPGHTHQLQGQDENSRGI